MLYPALTLLAEVLIHRRLRVGLPGLLLMAAGYLQYRLCGAYLMKEGQGSGFGAFSWRIWEQNRGGNRAPAKLVTTGPYAVTRNPMYLGHMVCMAGLVLAFRSPVAVFLALYHVWWLRERALEDESMLANRFPEEYAAYRERVARWLPIVRP